ncbi:MAG: hypothetical protein RLN75_08270 [Longimicrobiales bacterium]
MGWIPIDQATPGMALAAPVKDRMGRLLIPAGAELSDRHVEALAAWGVDRIEIESGEAPEPEVAVSPEHEARAREELAPVFRHAGPDHPFTEALAELAVARRARALALEAVGIA